jgi:hypothetical protein
MKSKTIVFSTANDLYDFNREASKVTTDIRVKTMSGSFDFDAKTLLGLFFTLNLPSIDVIYDETEKEFDDFLTRLEKTE